MMTEDRWAELRAAMDRLQTAAKAFEKDSSWGDKFVAADDAFDARLWEWLPGLLAERDALAAVLSKAVNGGCVWRQGADLIEVERVLTGSDR